jgi:hypothetical protein
MTTAASTSWRDPAKAIADAIAQRLRPPQIAAVLVAALALVVVQLGAPALGIAGWPYGAWVVGVLEGLAFGIAGTLALAVLIPRTTHRSLETIVWLQAVARVRIPLEQRSPQTVSAARTWLAAHGETVPSLAAIDSLLLLREWDRAHALALQLPSDDPWAAFERVSRMTWLDLLRGAPADLAAFREAAEATPDDRRTEARTWVALAEAHERAWRDAGGDTWEAPLLAARATLDASADGAFWRGYLRSQAVNFVIAGLAGWVILTALLHLTPTR